MKTDTIILPFDYQNASEAEYQKFLECINISRMERMPDDPPLTLQGLMGDYKNIPDFVVQRVYLAWKPDMSEVIGFSEGNILVNMDGNAHLFEYNLRVLAPYRRMGIGKNLFLPLLAFAQETGRRLMLTWTDSKVPAGDIVMEKMGAEVGLESFTNRLDVAELDRDLMNQWLAEGPVRGEGFTLGLWEADIPEEDLEQYVMIDRVMNTAPKGTLEIDDFNVTGEQVRQIEKNLAASGTERWTMFIRHNESGKVVGFTEMYYEPARSTLIGQGATGVLPEFRNHGLGRWLKAAMMDKVLRERPAVKYVYTGNAQSNGPMLKINNLMGFKPYKTNKSWQISVEKAAQYMAMHPELTAA